MNIEQWIANKLRAGEEASVSLALLERSFSMPLTHIVGWAKGVCSRLGCKSTLHLPSDVVTFYLG